MAGFKHADIQTLTLDVCSDENVLSVVATILEQEGKIDVVVNNAGVNCAGTMVDVPLEVVQKIFDANVYSVLRVSKAVFPHMAARKSGTIVNIGSIVGEILDSTKNCSDSPTAWNGVYAATKAAVRSISDVLWQESKPFNINVTYVAPGAVKSNIANTTLASGIHMPDDSLYKSYVAQITQRMLASQGPNSMPAEEFAIGVVTATLSPKPPRSTTLGGNAAVYKIFGWLPRTWVLELLWKQLLKLHRGST
ncbi:hypothetical protein PHLCEN_2v2789 [Hermanssonia centrifuga]|uniref:Uncharacterized protein n=1 Tax=Hermanssonia centrifuga TaxID=98765 RepID=A0A2R6RI06_9APHY|nr:hypothetical protein PHLCEN_2v2789 [Hermanssonia centrifuga]